MAISKTTVSMLITFLMGMIPIVELRGAIPYGAAAGLPLWECFWLAAAGNMLPVPFIILLIRRVFAFLRRSAWWSPKIDALERRAHLKGNLVKKYRLVGLVILVAIPLPGTGAWTGALVASLLDIRMRYALPAIAVGVLLAGVLVTLATGGVLRIFF
ncbi:small multi-drug export protein [Oscillibacter sp.]|uniref:COG2426 family protein n=1 Tax=Oscillibacter sp. TaxID=1945593 RepID=UPI0028B1784F|nr:small multi-drug export protein [Oscillibacter sp.]